MHFSCQLSECIPRLWRAGGSHQSKYFTFSGCGLCVISVLGCHGAMPCSPGCTSSEWGVWEGHSIGTESFQGAAVTQDLCGELGEDHGDTGTCTVPSVQGCPCSRASRSHCAVFQCHPQPIPVFHMLSTSEPLQSGSLGACQGVQQKIWDVVVGFPSTLGLGLESSIQHLGLNCFLLESLCCCSLQPSLELLSS